jgi:hypothetical protein
LVLDGNPKLTTPSCKALRIGKLYMLHVRVRLNCYLFMRPIIILSCRQGYVDALLRGEYAA